MTTANTTIATVINILGTMSEPIMIVTNWDGVKKWFKDFTKALIIIFTTVAPGVWHATGAFVDVVKKGFANIMHKVYYQAGNYYVEEIRTLELPENELTDWVKEKLSQNSGEVDITQEMERELEMTL